MQSVVSVPTTPRQTSHSHTCFATPNAASLKPIDPDFKLSAHATRTPFTTPRGPPTPPDSGDKRTSVNFEFLMQAEPSLQESPFIQTMSAQETTGQMTPSSTLATLPSLASSLSTTSTLASASSFDSLDKKAGVTEPAPKVERTPNVYVNGLPPNFPEEQLLSMTREFGNVQSARTFTRHVADRPSGYGFVLFDNVDDAERCIEALRKYRNLHPSFAKQMHKIPGTTYANVPASARVPVDQDPHCFKAKMERLSDRSSTNLYMEGLPLSIDEPTLAALVAPHTIKSSRFFQTKLSHPPRIIAFVRLETREACEEVIEALHGRMVRGWNDSGSRISVRFADSNGQRELRRHERTGVEGDQASPAKLTMAQAALLNLRGGDTVQGANTLGMSASMPSISPMLEGYYNGSSPGLALNGFPSSTSFNVSPNAQVNGLSPALQHNSAHARLPQHPMIASYAMPTMPSLPSVDSNFAAVLNDLQISTAGHETGGPALGRAVGSAGLRPQFNGFTPIEQQLILQGQAQQRVLEAQTKALELQRAVVLEAQARLAQQQQTFPTTVEIVPTPAEQAQLRQKQQQQQEGVKTRTRNVTTTRHTRPASMDYNQKIVSAPHTRSTTLPSAPRVVVDSPLISSPGLSFSARSSPSVSSSAGLSPMTPAFIPGPLNADAQLDSTTANQNVKTVGSGDGAVQVVGLGVDMGAR